MAIWSYIEWLLGLGLQAHELATWQMMVRAFVVFVVAIAMIRVSDERFMGRHTALDVLLGIVFGSVVSRAITGTAPFFPTLAASIVLVAMHWVLASLAYHHRWAGKLLKGPTYGLVEDGSIQWDSMRKTHITENDLREAIRQHGHPDAIELVAAARLERDGSISIIPKEYEKRKRPPVETPPPSK